MSLLFVIIELLVKYDYCNTNLFNFQFRMLNRILKSHYKLFKTIITAAREPMIATIPLKGLVGDIDALNLFGFK